MRLLSGSNQIAKYSSPLLDQAKIGAFLDPITSKPNSSPDFAAEALRMQYDSVFSAPRPAWSVSDPKEHFLYEEGDGSLSDCKFSPAP